MNWKFWQKPIPFNRTWVDDWQVGDIAEVVPGRWNESVPPWLRLPDGSRHKVVGMREGLATTGNVRAYFLVLEGSDVGYVNWAFRKVRPVEKSEIVERILTAKPGADRVRETT